MRHLLTLSVVVAGSLAVGACGGNDSKGGITNSTLTIRSIAVTLSSPLVVGGTAQASAIATMSDGTTQAITTGFKSDVPTVATVTDAGAVTAAAAGAANIYVVSDGVQGTKNMRVVPSYAGTWSGSYYVTNCSQTGAFAGANLCQNFPVNRVLPYNMVLAQASDSVSGTTYIGSLQMGSSTSTIGMAGDLTLSGTYVEDTMSLAATWNLTCATAGKLDGTVQQVWRDSSVTGQMLVNGTIRDSMKMAHAAPVTDGQVEGVVRQWRQRSIK